MSKKSYNNPYKIIEMLKKENQSLNKLYQETLLKMKEIQKDYDSMYSNLSKEDKKEINPNCSKNKYLFLSKHLSKHEINIGQIPQNKENDLFLINENLNLLIIEALLLDKYL